MRVGGLSSSSHAAGMSALWHDPEFDPAIRRFETPLVQKTFDDLPVPTEQHELPDGVSDPFKKLDAIYDAAAVQMERGIKGAEFLHGKKPVVDHIKPDEMTRLQDRPVALDPAKQTAQRLDKQEREHHQRLGQAAVAKPVTSSSATKTAAQKETDAAANGGAVDADSVVGAALTFAPMAAAQAATTLVQGPLPALAAQAINTTGAVASVADLAMVGVAEATKETKESQSTQSESSSSGTPRRGLRK